MQTNTLQHPHQDRYLCTLSDVRSRISAIDPLMYARSRNYLDGAVTRLSPFISHGVIHTRDIAQSLSTRYSPQQCDKLFSELAWREYFQYQWLALGEGIFSDIRYPQSSAQNALPSEALLAGTSGIDVIDSSVQQLLSNGYMHNHARMWLAFMHCHVAKTHWLQPAKWLYYYLLDGDLASNFLSWQWVAGTFSNKPYIANQTNLNKYSGSQQQGTCIDLDYAQLANINQPACLSATTDLDLPCSLPNATFVAEQCTANTTLCYSIWNLDANWHAQTKANRILLLEPQHFARFPISDKRWQFILHWARQINGLQIFVGAFSQLQAQLPNTLFVFRQHPTCQHWQGSAEARPFLFPLPDKSLKGFFPFWKAVKESLV